MTRDRTGPRRRSPKACPRRRRGTDPSGRVVGMNGVKCALITDRAHTRATTTVRDAESLVQVQVAHIRANEARDVKPTWAFMLAPSMYT